MSSKYWKACAAVGGLLLLSAPLAAHHSIASQYDFDKEVAITGVLQRVEWISPHSVAILEVPASNGTKETWVFEFAGLDRTLSAQLRAAPSKGGLAPGFTVTMYGFQAKNGKLQAFLKQLKMPDGRIVVAWFGDPNA